MHFKSFYAKVMKDTIESFQTYSITLLRLYNLYIKSNLIIKQPSFSLKKKNINRQFFARKFIQSHTKSYTTTSSRKIKDII